MLKSLQNKKGLKIFQLPTFRCLFLQLAWEKDTEKWAAGKILGPSYFEATLVEELKLFNPKIITQGSSNCGGAPDCQGCLFMPRNRPFLLHLTFTYCFIFQSPVHLPTFLSIVGLYDGKKDHSIPINLLVHNCKLSNSDSPEWS